MGWIAITKAGERFAEGDPDPARGGRPVQKGEEGELACIAQEDYGHNVAVDLYNGIIAIDYDHLGVQNGVVELSGQKVLLWICEETMIVGEMAHYRAEFVQWKDENDKPVYQRDSDGKKLYDQPVLVRNDILTPLTWRPIWFTRTIAGVPTKVIGAQTTLPEEFGSRNVKKLVSLFADGRIGID